MMEPATAHLRECLNAIAAELRCNIGNATTDAVSRTIVERLKGTGGLLLLDEARHLGFPALEQIHIIQEKAEIGIGLIGNSVVYSQMGGGRGKSGFEQLRSRIVKRIELQAMTLEDVQPIAEMFGVTGQAELNVLTQIGRRDGALRDVVNVLTSILIESDDAEISLDRIVENWHDLSGERLRPERPAGSERNSKAELAKIGRAV